jgi:hypothetical protein
MSVMSAYLTRRLRNLRKACHCEAYFTIEIGRSNLNLFIRKGSLGEIQIASSSPIRSGTPRNDIDCITTRLAVPNLDEDNIFHNVTIFHQFSERGRG